MMTFAHLVSTSVNVTSYFFLASLSAWPLWLADFERVEVGVLCFIGNYAPAAAKRQGHLGLVFVRECDSYRGTRVVKVHRANLGNELDRFRFVVVRIAH